MQINKPTKRNYNSLMNQLWDHKPIVLAEAEVFRRSDDLCSLATEQDSPIQATVEDVLFNISHKSAQVKAQRALHNAIC